MRRFLLASGLLTLTLASFSQSASAGISDFLRPTALQQFSKQLQVNQSGFEGYVYSWETGQSVRDATVVFISLNGGRRVVVQANSNGYFHTSLPSGTYQVKANHPTEGVYSSCNGAWTVNGQGSIDLTGSILLRQGISERGLCR